MRARLYAALFVFEVAALAVLLPLVGDLYLHGRVDPEYAVNRYGTRGPVRLQKAPTELRILLVGGREAYGPELPWDGTVPFYLEHFLNNPVLLKDRPYSHLSVINAASPDGGAASLAPTLRDYSYLKPDFVVVYLDKSTARAGDDDGWRRRSPAFRRTGYYPLLPHLLQSRAEASTQQPEAFGWRAAAAAARGVERLAAAVAPARRTDGERHDRGAGVPGGCEAVRSADCVPIARAVHDGLERSRGVFVVSHPFLPAAEVQRHQVLVTALQRAASDPRRLRHIDVRPRLILADPALRGPAGLSQRGTSQIAEMLTQILFPIIEESM
jgi:hypothetical protein